MLYLMSVFHFVARASDPAVEKYNEQRLELVGNDENIRATREPGAWRELWLKEDYWAIWIGLGTVIIAYLFFANGSSIRWLAVTPAKWSDLSALGAHFQANYLRYIAQFLVFLGVFTFALTALGHKARDFVPSFTILYLLSVVIFALGQWDKANTYDLEPPLVALVVGLILANFVGLPRWLDAGFRVEFYVKIGIVLLGATLPFTLIIWAGPVAILQASIVSIVTFSVIYWVATRARPRQTPCGHFGRRWRGLRRFRCDCHRRRGRRQEGARADRDHHRDHLGGGDDLRAAVCRLLSASARRRRRRVDRHLGICRRGGIRGRRDVQRLTGATPPAAYQAVFAYTLIKVVGRDVWIGIWAFVLAIVATTQWERAESGRKPEAVGNLAAVSEIRYRLLIASLFLTFVTAVYSLADFNKTVVPALVAPVKDLRTWAFIFCFLSIGLTTRFRELASAGTKPFLAFSAGAIVNVIIGFVLSAFVFAAHWENLSSSDDGRASGCHENGMPSEVQVRPQCAQCESFRGTAKDLEALLPGLTSLSSAYASVRSDDGICIRHDRFVGARSCCADFSPAALGNFPQ